MRNYATARGIFSLLEFVGWVTVIGGVILAIAFGNSVGKYARPEAAVSAVLPGLIVALFGLLFVGAVQAWRASVDTAEYTQQMLKIARDQLEVSRQTLAGGKIDVPTFASNMDEAETKTGSSFANAVVSDTDGRTGAKPSVEGQDENALPAPESSKTPHETVEYRGYKIDQSAAGFLAQGVHFDTLELAKKNIDARQKANARLPGRLKI